jgi:serine/threonine protein kinase
MWSAGILLYEIIFKRHPFHQHSHCRQAMEQHLKDYTEVQFPFDNNDVSEQAKHLIYSLMHKNISGRFGASDALKHPWITRNLHDKLPLTS